MTDKPTDQMKLEAAVGKVAKAYDELVKTIERSSTVEVEHIAKAFSFAAKMHSDSHGKALLSLATAKAANGGFSLDKEYEPTPSPVPIGLQPKERLVGQNKKPKTPPDEDGCDFIDD